MSMFSDETREAMERVNTIRNNWEQNIISPEDMDYLLLHAWNYSVLKQIADESWARLKVDIFTKDMEIEELKRQLKEKNA